MKRATISIAILLAVLCPAAASAYFPPGFVGISPQNAANSVDYRLMREAGIQSVRLPLNWATVQAASPRFSEPDWSGFDRDVALAAENGIRVMPFVSESPRWVTWEPTDLPVASPRQRRAWAGFLRQAVGRYGPEGEFWEEHPDLEYLPFRRWEIWNEENIVSFASEPNPVRYAELLRVSGRALHRADPSAKVLIGGFFGRPLQIPPNVASGDFLSRIYRAGNVKRFFDGVALHPYVARAGAMRAQIVNLRRIMALHHDRATPLYITELGWGSASGPTRWERGLWGQARQLSRALGMLSAGRSRWRIGGVWWFTWSDEAGTCQFCRSAGLLTVEREAKPAWYRFIDWTGGDPDIVPRARLDGALLGAE